MFRVQSNKKSPVVAITFYSRRIDNNPGYHTGIFSAANKKDILRLKEGLELAATKRGKTLPQVEITLFLVPDWRKGEDYTSPSYLETKQKMLDEARKFYGEGILIKDFLQTKVSKAELDFLRNCESMGSVADILKTRTIIDSKGRPCLQTDSNVTWANNDFDKLYELTFEQDEDAFNASRCSEVYVSAHNKLVFTGSNSDLPSIFEKTLTEYCLNYNSDPWHKNANCNGVYDIAFCEGMCQHGLTFRVRVEDKYNKGKTFDFYPAKLQDPRYKLMPLVIACQRESWRAGMAPPDPVVVELTGGLTLANNDKKPALEVEINGVQYGYYHFKSLVRVFTNLPSWHADETKQRYSSQTKDYFTGAEYARNLFVSKQDTHLCMKILVNYYNAVLKAALDGELKEGARSVKILAQLIPNNAAGNQLCIILFRCTVSELHSNPLQLAKLPVEHLQSSSLAIVHVAVTPTYLQTVAPNCVGKGPYSFFVPSMNRLEKLMMEKNLQLLAKAADNLPAKEHREIVEFLKSLPQEQLEQIKGESKTAQQVFDEKYGLVPFTPNGSK
ncbi:hypothetical protein [Legionella lansingensis]|nr:hypothetical protein [Legionella lansingensis]